MPVLSRPVIGDLDSLANNLTSAEIGGTHTDDGIVAMKATTMICDGCYSLSRWSDY